MKRVLLVLTIPLLISLGTMTGITMLEHARTPTWERAFNSYRSRKFAAHAEPQIVKVVHAQLPWNFDSTLGLPVLPEDSWPWQIQELPYPPDNLNCILLTHPAADTQTNLTVPAAQVIFVAHHTDSLWRVGWLVHEGSRAPFPTTLVDDLTLVGCDRLLAAP